MFKYPKKYWPLQWLGLLELSIFIATFLTQEFQIGICPSIKNFGFHWNTCPMCPLLTLTALNCVIKTLFFTNSTRIHLTIYSLLFVCNFFERCFFLFLFLFNISFQKKHQAKHLWSIFEKIYFTFRNVCLYKNMGIKRKLILITCNYLIIFPKNTPS